MNILEELKLRGILKDISDIEKFNNLPKGTGIYIGFDPTATSLHLGNYIQISLLKRFEKYGFKPFALLGGATGMIGDPSFKNAERVLLDAKTINNNKTKIRKQLESYGLEVIDNYDWYKDMSIIDFLRDIGKMVNISYLLAKDSIKSRIDKGLSFTEFSYSLLQGYDFINLYKNKNVYLQLGGSDQWGNITTGLEMLNKIFNNNHKACVVTTNLLTDENGNKIGKSVGGGGLWIDKNLASPFFIYQYLLNIMDNQVESYLKWLTFLSLDEIKNVMEKSKKEPALRHAQKVLAYEVVKDVHNKKEAQKAIEITDALFTNSEKLVNLSANDIEQLRNSIPFIKVASSLTIQDALLEAKIVSSKRELNEFFKDKTITINNKNVENLLEKLDFSVFENKFIIIKRGKKKYYVLENKTSK
ncbi:tyrosyl tRNA synthetase [Mycoplasmopsis californica]|uniref:Tyrosine--tRNA ligase n=1 Tax=Mycoplasmopsis equigenitalium TaxID=114883 RepID=A0ABY5J4U0_9BACT|nr:tyrosine--tRNA ligase [Mycoplasmopsis equigenitalium]UUD37147.1 tyrosine--tRNA ligase [Mycoplasmopsis equigenitalium]VEU69548.1 tyrosyl tRNA synthetase [Mycoplasmopsis californica]